MKEDEEDIVKKRKKILIDGEDKCRVIKKRKISEEERKVEKKVEENGKKRIRIEKEEMERRMKGKMEKVEEMKGKEKIVKIIKKLVRSEIEKKLGN